MNWFVNSTTALGIWGHHTIYGSSGSCVGTCQSDGLAGNAFCALGLPAGSSQSWGIQRKRLGLDPGLFLSRWQPQGDKRTFLYWGLASRSISTHARTG